MVSQKIMDFLIAKWHACHHHMEDRVVINCKRKQYFELTKMRLIHQINDMNQTKGTKIMMM
jgi:hypothetical protein